MTEFETATLALQEATLAYQQASLALRESALWVAVAQVAASLAIGIGQIAVVWYGIRAMQRAGTQRACEQDQRHAEAMVRLDQQGRALEALIDGQRTQGEALAQAGRRPRNPHRAHRRPLTPHRRDATKMTTRPGSAVANLPESARRLAGAGLAPNTARVDSLRPRPD